MQADKMDFALRARSALLSPGKEGEMLPLAFKIGGVPACGIPAGWKTAYRRDSVAAVCSGFPSQPQ